MRAMASSSFLLSVTAGMGLVTQSTARGVMARDLSSVAMFLQRDLKGIHHVVEC